MKALKHESGEIIPAGKYKTPPAPALGTPALNLLVLNPGAAKPATPSLEDILRGSDTDVAKKLDQKPRPSRDARRRYKNHAIREHSAHCQRANSDTTYRYAAMSGITETQLQEEIFRPRSVVMGYVERCRSLNLEESADKWVPRETMVTSDEGALAEIRTSALDGEMRARILSPEYVFDTALATAVDTINGVKTEPDGSYTPPTATGSRLSEELAAALDGLSDEDRERVQMRTLLVLDHANIFGLVATSMDIMSTEGSDDLFLDGTIKREVYGDRSKTPKKDDSENYNFDTVGIAGIAERSFKKINWAPSTELPVMLADMQKVLGEYHDDITNMPMTLPTHFGNDAKSKAQNVPAFAHNRRLVEINSTFCALTREKAGDVDHTWLATPAELQGVIEAIEFMRTKQPELEESINGLSAKFNERVAAIKARIAEENRIIAETDRETREEKAARLELRERERENMANEGFNWRNQVSLNDLADVFGAMGWK